MIKHQRSNRLLIWNLFRRMNVSLEMFCARICFVMCRRGIWDIRLFQVPKNTRNRTEPTFSGRVPSHSGDRWEKKNGCMNSFNSDLVQVPNPYRNNLNHKLSSFQERPSRKSPSPLPFASRSEPNLTEPNLTKPCSGFGYYKVRVPNTNVPNMFGLIRISWKPEPTQPLTPLTRIHRRAIQDFFKKYRHVGARPRLEFLVYEYCFFSISFELMKYWKILLVALRSYIFCACVF